MASKSDADGPLGSEIAAKQMGLNQRSSPQGRKGGDVGMGSGAPVAKKRFVKHTACSLLSLAVLEFKIYL